ncbi:MAG: TetR/AcrR family transcriptional regulator [Alphaproteobacteria bacterium]|nr:TetR/AcrR family transcriptional regulator [Alphaproteobacteria bacterium]
MARNRSQTEEKILKAVGDIMSEPGGSRRLGVNAIADKAGVDKVLIYRYFGGVEGLLSAFAEKSQLWPTVEDAARKRAIPDDELARALAALVQGYLAALRDSPAALEAIAWDAGEKSALTQHLSAFRQRWRRDATARVFRSHKVPARVDIEAVMAVLAGAADYLAARGRFGGDFYGVALDDETGLKRIDDAIAAILQGVLNYAAAGKNGN